MAEAEAIDRVEQIEWVTDCLVKPSPDPELTRKSREILGIRNPSVDYFTACAWLARSQLLIGHRQGNLAAIGSELGDRIGLVASQEASCRYCFAAARLLLRFSGVDEDRIRRLEQGLLTAELSQGDRAALEFSRVLARANPQPGPDALDRMRAAGLSDDAIREVVAVSASYAFFNRTTTFIALQPHNLEVMPDRLAVRIMRPFIGRRIARYIRRGSATQLTPEQREGPWSEWVNVFDGLPFAPSLRGLIDAAWESPLLPRRTKALVAAVVARTLSCPLSENEAKRLLQDEGLSAQDVDGILAHLSSPLLEEGEAEILALARESVWYRPAQLQRSAKPVAEALGDGPFLEFVGWASLANALCRLSILLFDAQRRAAA